MKAPSTHSPTRWTALFAVLTIGLAIPFFSNPAVNFIGIGLLAIGVVLVAATAFGAFTDLAEHRSSDH